MVSVKDFRLECLCFLFSCIFKNIYPCSVITLPFNSDGPLRQNSSLVFLECINYFSFELVGVFRIFQFVLALVGQAPLGLIYTCLFSGYWRLLYKQFWICDLSVGVFVSCFRF